MSMRALFEHRALPGLAELLDDADAQQVQHARLRMRQLSARHAGADLLLRRPRRGVRRGCDGGKRLHSLHAYRRGRRTGR